MNTAPKQPLSLPELVDRDLPADRRRQLQEFVMSEIHQDLRTTGPTPRRPPRRRFILATSAVAAAVLAVTVAVGTGALRGSGDSNGTASPQSQPSTSQRSPVALTFELAAAYAAEQPYTPPRADQWIYIQNRNVAPSALAHDKGQNPDETFQLWIRADGVKMATINRETGRLDTWNQESDYPALCNLPTDPQQLLALLRAELMATPSDPRAPIALGATTPDEWDGLLFARIAMILDHNLLPPAVTAALWRAAALVPGVTQSPDVIDVAGRPAIAVGRIQEGWRFEQLLVDPDTYEYVGYRSVATTDYTYPDTSVTETAGSVQWATTRLAAAIVDSAGETS